MKAILEFNLDEQQDKEQFYVASNGMDLYLCLWDIEQALREYAKQYESKDMTEKLQAIDMIRDDFYAILEERGINMNKVS